MPAALAVDGNYDTYVLHCHCAHGNDGPGGPNWLVVDLGICFNIDHVAVTNRDSWGERKMNLNTLSGNVVWRENACMQFEQISGTNIFREVRVTNYQSDCC